MNEFKTPMFQAMQIAGRVKGQQQVIDSRDVADMIGKRHEHVLRGIGRILDREPNYKSEFIESPYRAGTGKSYRRYLVTQDGYERLLSQFIHRAQPASLERGFQTWLETLFNRKYLEKQKTIGGYRIDFVLVDSVFIEYDEKEHIYQTEYDLQKEHDVIEIAWKQTIEENPWLAKSEPSEHISFIRVKEGDEVEGIRKILLELSRVTGSELAMFLNKGETE